MIWISSLKFIFQKRNLTIIDLVELIINYLVDSRHNNTRLTVNEHQFVKIL